MTTDYGLYKFSDISRTELQQLLSDKMQELYLDCSLKPDPDVIEHTVRKLLDLFHTEFRSWCWGEFESICRLGITGAYGREVYKVNFQTIATWLKKAKSQRSEQHANKVVAENNRYKADTTTNYKAVAVDWHPVIFMNTNYKDDFYENPRSLKQAIEAGKISGIQKQVLQEKYPYVFSKQYPANAS